jgi:hypothetical protein
MVRDHTFYPTEIGMGLLTLELRKEREICNPYRYSSTDQNANTLNYVRPAGPTCGAVTNVVVHAIQSRQSPKCLLVSQSYRAGINFAVVVGKEASVKWKIGVLIPNLNPAAAPAREYRCSCIQTFGKSWEPLYYSNDVEDVVVLSLLFMPYCIMILWTRE